MNLLSFIIKAYQKTVSPQTGFLRIIYSSPVFCLFPNIKAGCRHYPRCSDYFLEAVSKHGISKGIVLTAKRLISCR